MEDPSGIGFRTSGIFVSNSDGGRGLVFIGMRVTCDMWPVPNVTMKVFVILSSDAHGFYGLCLWDGF